MKFAEKIIWSCLLTLAIVFSIGATFMLIQNHQYLLDTTIQQNLSNHDIEVYSLETRLLQDSLSYLTEFGEDENQMMNKAIYYIEQFCNVSSRQQKGYALSNQNDEIFYSNIDNEYISMISIEHNQTYFLKHLHQQDLMFVTTPITAGKNVYYLTTCYDLTYCYNERNRQIQSFIVISLFIFVLAFIILRFISSYLTQSIYKLNEVSQRIASGDYSERTQIESLDEIGELSRSFDEMAEKNEQTIHQLQDSIVQREEFMSSFSHEVKTPMTAILGFADMLRTCECDEETKQMAAQYIYNEGKRLEKLSYTLMDLLSIGEKTIKLQSVELESIVQQLKSYYDGKNSDYCLVFETLDISVKSQQELLFTLLRNLIDNAMKASQSGQNIWVRTKRVDNKVEIAVIDEGIGMSADDIKKATEPFYMADKSRSRSQGGSGLGLSIVKRICEVHQTELFIESTLQQGTTVSFLLEVI